MDNENKEEAAVSQAEEVSSGAVPATEAPKDPFFVPPLDTPTQKGPKGILYDFNDGARVLLPKGQWHVQIEDDDSGNVLFVCDVDEGWVTSAKKYYVPFRIKVWDRRNLAKPLLDHVMDLKGKPVLIKFPVGTLGDLIGWFPYAEKFLQKHKCKMECSMAQNILELFQGQYPDMTLSPAPKVKMTKPYASYRVGLFFRGEENHQPHDFRRVGLHRTAGYILGVDPAEVPPRLPEKLPREIKEPYVCIATKATTLAKMWNNGFGWDLVIDYLRQMGYRVLCIDRQRTEGIGHVWHHLPHDAEDFTGERPLLERAAMLHHADFFIGLSSGLSWLAWAAGTPVVLISGFSLPPHEFTTPYRVINTHVCHGCIDATDVDFDHKDYLWCPRHKGTERQFECTRAITGRQVIHAIERLMQDQGLKGPKDVAGKER